MINKLKQPLFLAAFAHLALEISNNFLPVIYPFLIADLGLTYTQVGVITLVSILGASLAQPVFGYLTDQWGPVHLTVVSIIWTGLIMGVLGLVHRYWLLVFMAGFGALGVAAFHPPGAIIASATTSTRRGAAVSIFSVGGNLGAAISPLIIGLGLAWFGLPGTLILIPVALGSSLILYPLLRQNYIGRQSHQTEARPISSIQPRTNTQSWLKHSASLGLLLIVLVVMSRSWFQVSISTYLPIWLESQGRSITVAGQVLSMLLISISVGSLSGGILSDYIGRWQVVGLSMSLMIIAHGLFMATTGWMQVAAILVIGVAIGATLPVTIVMAYELWPNRAGMAASLVMGIGWLPGGLGASTTGWLADLYSLALALQSLYLAPIFGLCCLVVLIALQRRINQTVVPEVT